MIQFTKMHGLGNDFVIINNLEKKIQLTTSQIQHLANRNMGIGFDQLLLIEPSKNADFYCQIFNADGSKAEQCGNGLRCVARYIQEEKLNPNKTFSIETIAGVYPLEMQDNQQIRIALGAPTLKEKLLALDLSCAPHKLPVSILSLGNPHTVAKMESIRSNELSALASDISSQPHFPNGTNVGFMQIVNANHIHLRTFERGAGETHGCGSNACAAVIAGISNGWLNSPVTVEFRYGSLEVEWQGGDKPVYLTGPAIRVFDGNIDCAE